jgi:type III secretion system FlhB-like substrate exporter
VSDKRVVGISYDIDSDSAPVVMLKAAGAEADALLKTANAQDAVPVVRDAALLNQLYRVPMDGPIGRELFPVMALLLAHVLKIDKEKLENRHE